MSEFHTDHDKSIERASGIATASDDDPDQDLLQLDTTSEVQCPFCGEYVSIEVDPATVGSMVQDCEVCCQPWQLEVSRDFDGCLQVTAHPAD